MVDDSNEALAAFAERKLIVSVGTVSGRLAVARDLRLGGDYGHAATWLLEFQPSEQFVKYVLMSEPARVFG